MAHDCKTSLIKLVVLDAVSKTSVDVGGILTKLNREEDITILNWLTPIDYKSQVISSVDDSQGLVNGS